MSRYIWAGWGKDHESVLLMTDPDDSAKVAEWGNERLASVRGEINYKLTDPHLGPKILEILTALRTEIEHEMRRRLAVRESADEYAARCLFHASAINYQTGNRENRIPYSYRRASES